MRYGTVLPAGGPELLLISDRIRVESNVVVLLKDLNGRVVDKREGHNIFVDQGRQWLRDTIAMGATSYPNPAGAGAPDQNMTGDGGQSGNADSMSVRGKTYRPRFIGLGVGGALQSITPPGPGGFIEETTVNRLEYPVKVTDTPSDMWLKEVLPQNDLTDTQIYPDAFKIRFRAIFGPNDVSFANQIDGFGTSVPISEAGLFTSQAGYSLDPNTGNQGTLGFIAYNIFEPIVKTPNFTLELAWELRF